MYAAGGVIHLLPLLELHDRHAGRRFEGPNGAISRERNDMINSVSSFLADPTAIAKIINSRLYLLGGGISGCRRFSSSPEMSIHGVLVSRPCPVFYNGASQRPYYITKFPILDVVIGPREEKGNSYESN